MPDEAEVPEAHRVIIAAAVAAALGPRARLLGIEAVDESVSDWTRRGRTALQRSHNLRSLARPDSRGPR
jgi:hypothetical protein